MLIEGWPDQRIANALGIPDTAVTGHIENILAKLAAPARDLAALRAVRHGLHVPPSLSQIRRQAAAPRPGRPGPTTIQRPPAAAGPQQ